MILIDRDFYYDNVAYCPMTFYNIDSIETHYLTSGY
jgi:hypothetical protein